MNQRILSCGNDEVLLQTRSLVLATAGFEVEVIVGVKGLLDRQFGSEVGLIVLCHTLSEQEQKQASRRLQLTLPGTPTLSLRGVWQGRDTRSTPAIDSFAGPKALIAHSRKLISK